MQTWFDRKDARPVAQNAYRSFTRPTLWGEADELAFLQETAAHFASGVKQLTQGEEAFSKTLKAF